MKCDKTLTVIRNWISKESEKMEKNNFRHYERF
jgi:hypothetical protein